MACYLLVHEFLLVVLLWLAIISYGVWQRSRPAKHRTTRMPVTRLTKRSKEQKPFAGLTQKPLCIACEHTPGQGKPLPAAPSPLIHSPCGRPRTVVTTHHFCPELMCRYYGWVGLGNIRANGHPSGSPSRQFQCVACRQADGADPCPSGDLPNHTVPPRGVPSLALGGVHPPRPSALS
jgi:hypothetical protein